MERMSAWFKGPILKPFSDRCFSSRSPVSTLKREKNVALQKTAYLFLCVQASTKTLWLPAETTASSDARYVSGRTHSWEPRVHEQEKHERALCDITRFCFFSYTLLVIERSRGEFAHIESSHLVLPTRAEYGLNNIFIVCMNLLK